MSRTIIRSKGASVILAVTAVVFGASLAAAAHHVNTTAGLTHAGAPLALRGYDPVAYFTEGKAVLGETSIAVKHDGAVYQFASEENKRRFEADPARYAPQYGGFCAYGAALGKKFDGDPMAFKVVDGKLFLNLDKEIQAKWEEDIPGNIAKANQQWKRIRDVSPSELK